MKPWDARRLLLKGHCRDLIAFFVEKEFAAEWRGIDRFDGANSLPLYRYIVGSPLQFR
jgi:hypothetical protein